jgi:hypothetical protein
MDYNSLLEEIDQILQSKQIGIHKLIDSDDDVPLSEMMPLHRSQSEKPPLIDVQILIESKFFLTSLSRTCAAYKLVSQLIKQHDLSGDLWALFELDTELNIERPIREWEKVSDILENSTCQLEMRQYSQKSSILAKVSL